MSNLQLKDQPLQPSLQLEQKPFTREEIRILQTIKNKKFVVIASSYATFIGILILGWFYARGRAARFGEDEIERYKYVAPIVISFLFVVLTIYFINYYLKSLHPYFKDLKGGVKELIYFEPESYKTPFFDTYYIKTISKKRALVKINKELYDEIKPGCSACISLSPAARFVFAIKVGEKKMEFNEKNSILDM